MAAKLFAPFPAPKSGLGVYQVLAPNAAVRVSPLAIGGMNFGDKWADLMGAMSKDQVFELLDYFYDQGGNYIDTANSYQGEQSEKWIGEWLESRKNRESIVLATKFTTNYKVGQRDAFPIQSNFGGNTAKSLRVSVDASLKKLQTDYIDLLYVHWFDYTSTIEELCINLNHLVAAGKVLYLGVSDTPAWFVAQFNQYAKDHGLTPFSVYQGRWSAAERDFEREIIPMCRANGMGLAIWGALGGGKFKTKAEFDKMKAEGDQGRNRGATPAQEAVLPVLEKISNDTGYNMTGVALAYIRTKEPYTIPIVGGRKISHLKENIRALELKLTDEQIKEIEDAIQFDPGFPHNFIVIYHCFDMKDLANKDF